MVSKIDKIGRVKRKSVRRQLLHRNYWEFDPIHGKNAGHSQP